MSARRSITENDPQDAVLATAAVNVAAGDGDAWVGGVDAAPAIVQGWQLPDGHLALQGQYVTLADGQGGIVTNTTTGPTGLGMVEIDGGMQHASNVTEVREPTAKERKAAGVQG
jgi:hypothetical protein